MSDTSLRLFDRIAETSSASSSPGKETMDSGENDVDGGNFSRSQSERNVRPSMTIQQSNSSPQLLDGSSAPPDAEDASMLSTPAQLRPQSAGTSPRMRRQRFLSPSPGDSTSSASSSPGQPSAAVALYGILTGIPPPPPEEDHGLSLTEHSAPLDDRRHAEATSITSTSPGLSVAADPDKDGAGPPPAELGLDEHEAVGTGRAGQVTRSVIVVQPAERGQTLAAESETDRIDVHAGVTNAEGSSSPSTPLPHLASESSVPPIVFSVGDEVVATVSCQGDMLTQSPAFDAGHIFVVVDVPGNGWLEVRSKNDDSDEAPSGFVMEDWVSTSIPSTPRVELDLMRGSGSRTMLNLYDSEGRLPQQADTTTEMSATASREQSDSEDDDEDDKSIAPLAGLSRRGSIISRSGGRVVQEIDVPVRKVNGSLGVQVAGEVGHGVYIAKIREGGPAQEDGLLRQGDRIVAIGDRDLTNVTHAEAVEAIKEAPETTTLRVWRKKRKRSAHGITSAGSLSRAGSQDGIRGRTPSVQQWLAGAYTEEDDAADGSDPAVASNAVDAQAPVPVITAKGSSISLPPAGTSATSRDLAAHRIGAVSASAPASKPGSNMNLLLTPSQAACSGYLLKQNSKRKWKRRYVSLQDNILKYYRSRPVKGKEGKADGYLVLDGDASVRRISSRVFTVQNAKATWHLGVDTSAVTKTDQQSDEVQRWIDALKNAFERFRST